MHFATLRLFALLLLPAAVPLAVAQQPQVTNAQFSTQPAGDLAHTLDTLEHAPAPLWVAYLFPTDRPMTTTNRGYNGVIHLEQTSSGSGYQGGAYTQSSEQALLLLRFADGQVSSSRLAQPSDALDAGGLRFVFLTGVPPEQSVAALKSIALTASAAHQRKDAVFFLSLHRSPDAVPTLEDLAAPGHGPEVREAAAFWLANQRGHAGFLAIRKLVRQDPDPSFRRKLAFDLTLSRDPEALPELVRMAHQDASPAVREQAQFWMAQQARNQGGNEIAGELHAAAEDDPDAHSRKQAVFALSRLPAEQATPQLVALVRTSKDPEVRKQAVFWLGQSHDPAALDFLTTFLQQPANSAH